MLLNSEGSAHEMNVKRKTKNTSDSDSKQPEVMGQEMHDRFFERSNVLQSSNYRPLFSYTVSTEPKGFELPEDEHYDVFFLDGPEGEVTKFFQMLPDEMEQYILYYMAYDKMSLKDAIIHVFEGNSHRYGIHPLTKNEILAMTSLKQEADAIVAKLS